MTDQSPKPVSDAEADDDMDLVRGNHALGRRPTYRDRATLLRKVDELTAALAGKWLPIETAPKDGTHILAGYIGDDEIIIVRWSRVRICWSTVPGYTRHPSCWQPLPASPIDAALGEGGKGGANASE